MTLILTVATEKAVVQAADRRLTLSDGRVFTDETMKQILVLCASSYFVISYTGLAKLGSRRTDLAIVEHLADIGAGSLGLNEICESLKSFLKRSMQEMRHVSRPWRKLTLVLAGFGVPGPFVTMISNFESWRPPVHLAEAEDDFQSEFFGLRVKEQKKGKFVGVHGASAAITDRINFRLRHYYKKDYWHEASTKNIADTLVSIIREAAQTPGTGKLIGSDCIVSVVPPDPNYDAITADYSLGRKAVRSMPHMISPSMAVQQVEIRGRGPVSVGFATSWRVGEEVDLLDDEKNSK